MADSGIIQAVFVYGTLKRGQCRAGLWPAEPTAIVDAWTHGHLYGRHDYPALTPGKDRVRGELWRFSAQQMNRVTEVLDQVEGVNQPGFADLYVRTTAQIWGLDHQTLEIAYTYHYATLPSEDGFTRLRATESGLVCWPPTQS